MVAGDGWCGGGGEFWCRTTSGEVGRRWRKAGAGAPSGRGLAWMEALAAMMEEARCRLFYSQALPGKPR